MQKGAPSMAPFLFSRSSIENRFSCIAQPLRHRRYDSDNVTAKFSHAERCSASGMGATPRRASQL